VRTVPLIFEQLGHLSLLHLNIFFQKYFSKASITKEKHRSRNSVLIRHTRNKANANRATQDLFETRVSWGSVIQVLAPGFTDILGPPPAVLSWKTRLHWMSSICHLLERYFLALMRLVLRG